MKAVKAGFTLVEVVVAVVLLLVVAVATLATTRTVAASLQRSTLELRAAQLIQDEVLRLRTLPINSLAAGDATRPGGSAVWVVTDSTEYLRVELVLTTAPVAGLSRVDTVYVYRVR